jgi:hypothetical protein
MMGTEDFVDEILEASLASRPGRGGVAKRKGDFHISFLGDVEPFDEKYGGHGRFDSALELMDPSGLLPDAKPSRRVTTSEIGEPFDFSYVLRRSAADAGAEHLRMVRLRRVTPATRGVILPARRVVEASTVQMDDGVYVARRFYVGSDESEVAWRLVGPESPVRERKGYLVDKWDKMIEAATVMQFARQSMWTVRFRYEGSPFGVELPTDPVGAREAFRLRDIPEGAKRRAALRNWVAAHHRRKHDDPSAEVEVRKHLRGATNFVWNGMKCTVTPSSDDQRLAARLATERMAK